MGAFFTTTTSFLGSPAGDQVIAASEESKSAVDLPEGFTPEELDRRRAVSRRLAWVLGLAALAIYLLGFIFYRP